MVPGTDESGAWPGGPPEALARLFRQIRIARRREAAVFRAFRRRFGSEVAEVTGLDEEDFAAREREGNLEALLGNESVPGWLREVLERQVRSEAILLSHLLRRYGKEGWALARRSLRDFGRACGTEARKGCPEGRGIDLLAALGRDHLHGFPNQSPALLEPCPGGYVVRRAHCPSQQAWTMLGAPARSLCDLDRSWVTGYCEGFGGGLRHRAGPCIVAGEAECADLFVKKGPRR
ncbi:MAG TPA: hypothetical protein VFI25_09550 [Planctomycetota bacterium]|jgi:hypothetical protein|nr:hypothetical protein [Planctomycetota bacterium]